MLCAIQQSIMVDTDHGPSISSQRFVLGEIIKVSNLDIATLVEFIKTHNVEPNWLSMQLPGGMSPRLHSLDP